MTIFGFHLGMRTFKTAVSVFLCILISMFVLHTNPMLSSLAAIFTLRQDMETSIVFGKARIYGIILAGVLTFSIISLVPIHSAEDVKLLWLVPLAISLLITIASRIKLEKSIIAGCATLLILFFGIPKENQFEYILIRLLATILGVVIALFVNYCLPTTHLSEQISVKETINETRNP